LQITKPECIKLIGIKEKCLIEKINDFFTLIILIFTPHKMQKLKNKITTSKTEKMEELTFRVKAHSENPTKTVVKARTFKMIIDEPTDLGGTNDGPNPVEYVLAALSGCLNVMCHIVAQEMNIKLKGVEIKISGALNPEKLFGKETENRAGYKSIHVEIKPDTDTDKDTLQKWIQTVETRCPVSDNLTNPTPVHIALA
jgi:uncharacterized OsmC-like protein